MIGRHDGAIYYTFGQRHGMGLGGGLPYYVVGKDMSKNEVYVSRNLNDTSFWRSELMIENPHWISGAPSHGQNVSVRLRHRASLLPARIDGTTIFLEQPERAISSGQSAVVYVDDACLGGGIII